MTSDMICNCITRLCVLISYMYKFRKFYNIAYKRLLVNFKNVTSKTHRNSLIIVISMGYLFCDKSLNKLLKSV